MINLARFYNFIDDLPEEIVSDVSKGLFSEAVRALRYKLNRSDDESRDCFFLPIYCSIFAPADSDLYKDVSQALQKLLTTDLDNQTFRIPKNGVEMLMRDVINLKEVTLKLQSEYKLEDNGFANFLDGLIESVQNFYSKTKLLDTPRYG